MAIQAQFQNPSPYFLNNILLEDFQSQFLDCTSNHQSDLTNYYAPVSDKRAREDDSANSSSCRNYSDLFISHFYSYSLETDAVIRAQYQKLKSELERVQLRQYQGLLSATEHRLIQILQIKAVEYESLERNNRELEEKIRQISEENQIWYNVMKNNEAMVTSLKATLDKVLQQNSLQLNDVGATAKEGYGDSDGTALVADDATSCSYEVDGTGNGAVRNATERWLCRMCIGADVSVLVLPCRHLCLCTACEIVCSTCPVCGVGKKASLQVLLC